VSPRCLSPETTVILSAAKNLALAAVIALAAAIALAIAVAVALAVASEVERGFGPASQSPTRSDHHSAEGLSEVRRTQRFPQHGEPKTLSSPKIPQPKQSKRDPSCRLITLDSLYLIQRQKGPGQIPAFGI
jgi:hypothetical protein